MASSLTYSASLNNKTHVVQSSSFFYQASSANFGGVAFNIGSSTLKWSVNLSATEENDLGTIVLSYLLADVMIGSSGEESEIVVERNRPYPNMTTYLMPLSGSAANSNHGDSQQQIAVVAQLELFDIAFIDGVYLPIKHSVNIVNTTTSNSSTTERAYELVLQFPAFATALYYDPSLSLGALVGSTGTGSQGGSSSTDLIIAVSVIVPFAVLVVVLTVIIGTVVLVLLKRKQREVYARRQTTLAGQL